MKNSTAQPVDPVLGPDEIMKLADAYADASFEQGLNQFVETPIPEQRRDALYAAINAKLTSNTAPQEPAVNAELLEAIKALREIEFGTSEGDICKIRMNADVVISKATGSAA